MTFQWFFSASWDFRTVIFRGDTVDWWRDHPQFQRAHILAHTHTHTHTHRSTREHTHVGLHTQFSLLERKTYFIEDQETLSAGRCVCVCVCVCAKLLGLTRPDPDCPIGTMCLAVSVLSCHHAPEPAVLVLPQVVSGSEASQP